MPRKKKSESEPKKERVVTEQQLYAAMVTAEMNPDPRRYNKVFGMNIKHIYDLCYPKNGAKAYHPLDVIGCWRNLRSPESVAGIALTDAGLLAVLSGTPMYIERWIAMMLDLPAVYESHSHDCAVKERADFLRRHNFHYGATGLPNRLTAEEVQELGL